jgi:8-oxo-dGTP pyrophosphatase MutT (NUDIX family)/phosphohistidine phosphatase SixA
VPPASDVLAAGVVVFRPGREVLLVHRPKYDDWSFPKGKLDRGELAPVAAVREVAEETGLRVRLGVPLASQRYPVNGSTRSKTVFYWVGRCVGDDDVSGYPANHEIDRVRWVGYNDALPLLTYNRDRDTLRETRKVRRRTHAVVVLRHGAARSRRAWRADDRDRPLLKPGMRQAEAVVPLLAAYDVTRLVTSTSVRCLDTLTPYAEAMGLPLETSRRLSEEDATRNGVTRILDALIEGEESAVLCSHRPVLPHVYDALGLENPGLAAGEMLVVHVRNGEVRGTERHAVR